VTADSCGDKLQGRWHNREMASDLGGQGLKDALVILGAAGIVIPAFARLKISPVIGFIVVGVIAGPFGLGAMADQFPWLRYVTITKPETIAPFAQFGIILMLFSIGLELSFGRLWGMRRLVFGVGFAEFTLIALILGAGLYWMGFSLAGSVALGLALSNSSIALVMPLVRMSTPVGRTAFAVLLFEDLAIVPVIFVLGVLAPDANRGGIGLEATLVRGVLVIAAMLLIGRLLLPRLFAQAARTKSSEVFLSASLLVVISASLATAAVGLSPIMGALIAGILIAETEYRSEVEVITAPFRGLAIGVFLITVGMSVDFRVVVANWAAILAAVVAVLLIKALVTAAMLRMSGTATRAVATEVGILMASPSEMTLVVIAATLTARLIDADTAAFWQIVTAIGMTITPLLAKAGQLAARRVDPPANEVFTLGEAEGRIVIFGFGRVGQMVATMLTEHGRPYLAVESDIDSVMAAREAGFHILFGDVARGELADKLQLGRAAALVLTMDDPVLVAQLARRVRGWVPELPIIARARDTDHAAQLYKAGVTDAVPETLEASLQLAEAVLVDVGVPMGPVIASIHEKRSQLRSEIMAEAELEAEPSLGRRRLRDAGQAPETGSNRSTPAT
jgi:CPA2 family monovalent cation:H+ antiporter-2